MQFLKTIIFLFLAIAGSYAQAFYTSTQLEAMKSDIYLRPQKISGITTANYKHIRLNEVLPNLIAGTNISITGTYPNKTISATFPTISLIAGSGISISVSGSNYTISNTIISGCTYIPDNLLTHFIVLSTADFGGANVVSADYSTLAGAQAVLDRIKNQGKVTWSEGARYFKSVDVGNFAFNNTNSCNVFAPVTGYFVFAASPGGTATQISNNSIIHIVNSIITGIYPQ